MPLAKPGGDAVDWYYAGFIRRLLATLLDGLLLGLALPLMMGLLGGTEALLNYGSGFAGDGDLGLLLLDNLLPAVLTIVLWVVLGATPGKFLMGCHIVDQRTGRRPSIARALLRYFGYLLSALPLGLGFFWILWDRRHQGWHDKVAGTLVVMEDDTALELPELLRRLG
jgi:uncharacterized RDD family membrane protein YckC